MCSRIQSWPGPARSVRRRVLSQHFEQYPPGPMRASPQPSETARKMMKPFELLPSEMLAIEPNANIGFVPSLLLTYKDECLSMVEFVQVSKKCPRKSCGRYDAG